MSEEWKPWRDGAYEVSSLGRVRRAKPGRRTAVGHILKQSQHWTEYPTVRPVVGGKNVFAYVHHMVAEAFIGPRPAGMVVNHIDANKYNAAASNLEYVTQPANMQHAARAKRMARGERHSGAKFTDAQVAEMRALRASGVRQCDIARRLGASAALVSQVLSGQRRAA